MKEPSRQSGVRMFTSGWLSRALHRSSPHRGWPAFLAISKASCNPGTVFMSIERATTASPCLSTRSCRRSVRMTASAETCGVPASAAERWLVRSASSLGSRAPSATSRAMKRDWSRAGSRCNRVRSRMAPMIRSLRSRTRSTVFCRPLSSARINAVAVTAMMTPNVAARASRMERWRGSHAKGPSRRAGRGSTATAGFARGPSPSQRAFDHRADGEHPTTARRVRSGRLQ